jgi:hypothetical protein
MIQHNSKNQSADESSVKHKQSTDGAGHHTTASKKNSIKKVIHSTFSQNSYTIISHLDKQLLIILIYGSSKRHMLRIS